MFSNKTKQKLLEDTVFAHSEAIAAQKGQIATLQSEILKLKSEAIERQDEYNEDGINLVARIADMEKVLKPFISAEQRKEGPEPFIAVISESWHPEFGIELKLDWNDAMINFLKRNGYAGVDDEQIVQQYVYDLFRDKVQEVRT